MGNTNSVSPDRAKIPQLNIMTKMKRPAKASKHIRSRPAATGTRGSPCIWTVATIGLHKERCMAARTWGYFLSRKEAIQGMRAECNDEAGYYTHAINYGLG